METQPLNSFPPTKDSYRRRINMDYIEIIHLWPMGWTKVKKPDEEKSTLPREFVFDNIRSTIRGIPSANLYSGIYFAVGALILFWSFYSTDDVPMKKLMFISPFLFLFEFLYRVYSLFRLKLSPLRIPTSVAYIQFIITM